MGPNFLFKMYFLFESKNFNQMSKKNTYFVLFKGKKNYFLIPVGERRARCILQWFTYTEIRLQITYIYTIIVYIGERA